MNFILLTVYMKLQLSFTTHSRYQVKEEKWVTETTEVMFTLMKLPLTCEKGPFSRSLCKCLFIYLLYLLQRIFYLLAVKWPKIAVCRPPPPPPPL